MSEEEKALDKLAAIEEYQEAKAEIAHIERKLHRFYSACQEIGRNAEGGIGIEPRIVNGEVDLFRCSSSDLMNGKELLDLLIEQQQARKRLSTAREVKENFNISLV